MYSSGNYVESNKETIKSILQNHGYSFQDHENYISCGANFRGVNDTSSVVIYPNENKVIDFAGGFRGNIKEFLQLVTEQKSIEELNKYLQNNNIIINEINNSPKIKQPKKFDKSLLTYLQSDHYYPISRGISEETCKLFHGGLVGDVKGKQKNRYVFPIYNSKMDVVGFTGRTINNDNIKWKHSGTKTEWVWPGFLNNKEIGICKSVILVESPMCVLSLFDSGVKNVICLFGVELSLSILNFLLKRGVEKIIIATNNELESNNGGVGNEASIKIKNKLGKYFDSKNIIIKLPPKKDFGEMSKEEIKKYNQELIFQLGQKYFKYE